MAVPAAVPAPLPTIPGRRAVHTMDRPSRSDDTRRLPPHTNRMLRSRQAVGEAASMRLASESRAESGESIPSARVRLVPAARRARRTTAKASTKVRSALGYQASTAARWRTRSASGTGATPRTRRHARRTSCCNAAVARPTIGAISSKGMSCSTSAIRSAERACRVPRAARSRPRGSRSARAGARPGDPRAAMCARAACRGTPVRRPSSAIHPGSRRRWYRGS